MTTGIKRAAPWAQNSLLTTRVLVCNQGNSDLLAKIREEWKKYFRVWEPKIHVQDPRYERLKDCGKVLDMIHLDETQWPVRRRLGIVVENEKGEPQALATCSLEYFSKIERWKLKLNQLVTSPENIVDGIKGSGRAAMAQVKVLCLAFSVEEIFLATLSSAIPFYLKQGFTMPSIDRCCLSAKSITEEDSGVHTVEGQDVLVKMGCQVENEEMQQLAQSCRIIRWIFALNTLKKGMFERLLAKPKVLKDTISKVQEKCQGRLAILNSQKEEVIKEYSECVFYVPPKKSN